ncbi:MAG: glycosyltransferase [Chloroflexi bacterium]|nr:glycosyltransferase [Chloroflexota bacterium]
MQLTVVSHKLCWPSAAASTGYATSGGFPFQMGAISELFDATRLVVPCLPDPRPDGEVPIEGHNIQVVPLPPLHAAAGLRRRLALPGWMLRSLPVIWREIRRAEGVHTPIPSDVGTFGMLFAYLLGKPLFVRHCGNWFNRHTLPQRFWRWFMRSAAGGHNVMLATGGALEPPAPGVEWIFSTSLTGSQLQAVGHVRSLPQSPRLITVGRQEKAKGTHLIIAGLAALRQAFPGIRLDVVGDGTYLPELRRLAAEAGVSAEVHFHGRVGHATVLELLAGADLFVYPSESEGFPKAVLEALASGLPVITTHVSVLPLLIGDCAGVVLREPTAVRLSAAIRELLSDPDRYTAASRCALERAAGYTLESWRDTIGDHLVSAWGLHRQGN